MFHCSVVIRTYNEERHIGRLLTGLLQQTHRDVEVLIVDSGSTDSTVAIASRFPVRVVHIPKEQFTFGRSLNQGIELAAGEFIVAASGHVFPIYDDWLDRLLEPFADPSVGLAYGKQRGSQETRYSEHRLFAQWFPDSASNQHHPAFCNNANAAVRRSIWEKLKYDETLTGLEDLDFAVRMRERGWRIAYVPEAVVAHVHQETPSRIYNRFRRDAIALRRIFPEEQFHARDGIRLVSANIASDAFSAWRERSLLRNLTDIVTFRVMQFYGTYRGFSSGPVTSDLKRQFYYPSPVDMSETSDHSSGRAIDYTAHQTDSEHDDHR